MIRGVTFISRVVRDLNVSLAFYRDTLGLQTIMGPMDVSGSDMDAMTGIAGVQFRIVMLRGPEGAVLELMQFLSPTEESSAPMDPCEVGHTFVALEVTEITKVVAELEAKGVQFQSPVQEYQGAKFAYIWGPDLELVELMEFVLPPFQDYGTLD